MTPILETRGLSLSYPGFDLQDIDLRVDAGSIMGLIGPSGAGKTSIMRLVMGQVMAARGELSVAGLTHPGDLKEIRGRVGYVPEDPPFSPAKRVADIIRFVAPFYPQWESARFNDLLGDFGIEPHLQVKHLSRGRRTLLSWAMALSHGATLLLLDEPAAGLDAARRRQVLKLMAEFVADGDCAAVISTHQTDGLAPLADRLAIIDHGRLVLSGETEELLAAWKWLRYRDGAVSDELESALLGHERGAFGNRGLVRDYPAIHNQLQAALAAGDVQVGNATIDDILVSLTGGH